MLYVLLLPCASLLLVYGLRGLMCALLPCESMLPVCWPSRVLLLLLCWAWSDSRLLW